MLVLLSGLKTIDGKPNRQLEVPCPGATDSDLFILRWYKDGFQLVEWMRQLDGPKWFVKDSKRYALKDFTLKVIFAKFDDSGEYKCEGLSRNMTDIIIEEEYQVHVRGKYLQCFSKSRLPTIY